MSETAPTLSVDRMAFAFPHLPLFRDWSHDFPTGLTWVRGDNGCGKSTLLRLLGGALEPRAGSIRYGTIDAQTQPLDYRRHVYWCGPDGVAFDHLKPLEFFGFIASLYPGFDVALPAMLVEALGLEPFLERRIHQLSTGSRKKVAVIAAMAAMTPVVLLDEPLAALDRISSNVLKAHLASASLQSTRVWILASHEPLGDDARLAHRLDLPSNAG